MQRKDHLCKRRTYYAKKGPIMQKKYRVFCHLYEKKGPSFLSRLCNNAKKGRIM